MKNYSSIIPKIVGILAFLSVIGIILLFFNPRKIQTLVIEKPDTNEKLFTQVIQAARPKILRLWEEGESFSPKNGLKCDNEISFERDVGSSYYQCQPHFWQCYWSGGVIPVPSVKIDLFGQTYHVRAKASFPPIANYSSDYRYYQILKGPFQEMNIHYGVMVELEVEEIPDFSWPIILTDSCGDTYLPERIYGYGKIDKKEIGEGFVWDNFGRNIFIDRFYVTNQQVNEWRILTGKENEIVTDRKMWPWPAALPLTEQKEYCSFWGKRLLEAKLFDAASMAPVDTKNPTPNKVIRPNTPWQRDLSKTFLGMARINPDYQLTPLDCQLAQVRGCSSKYFSTDSVTWMGINYALGFYPESLDNTLEPKKNLKPSSKYEMAFSELHELGLYTFWDGQQEENRPIAFRCYEEVD